MRRGVLVFVLLLAGCCPEKNEATKWCEKQGGKIVRSTSSKQILCVDPEGNILK